MDHVSGTNVVLIDFEIERRHGVLDHANNRARLDVLHARDDLDLAHPGTDQVPESVDVRDGIVGGGVDHAGFRSNETGCVDDTRLDRQRSPRVHLLRSLGELDALDGRVENVDRNAGASPALANPLRANLDEVLTVRNVPMGSAGLPKSTKTELGFDENRFMLLLQGGGINMNRGGEELVEAMKHIEKADLVIIGSGDALPDLKRMANEFDLNDRIRLLPRMLYEDMMYYTSAADLGFSLDKDGNLNYRFSLPNKIFDYAMAGGIYLLFWIGIPALSLPGLSIKPSRLDLLLGFSVGFPYMIDWLGHFLAHFSHIMQKSQTPNSIGVSGMRGRSVKTLVNRTLGPNSGVISRPLRASSPRPASIARGMLQAVSLPQAMALYPNPLI